MAEKILIISPVPLFPGHAGNRERIRAICSELMKRGYVVDFFYAGFDSVLDENHVSFFNGDVLKHNVDSYKLSWTGNPVQRISEIINGFKDKAHKWLRHLLDGPDSAKFNKSIYQYRNSSKLLLLKNQLGDKTYKAVIVNYAPYSFYFDLFPAKTIRIVDTHDRLTDRFKLFSESNQSPVDWHSLRYRDEKRALSKADVVWAITHNENQHFKNMFDDDHVKVFTLTHLKPFEKVTAETTGKNIVMIGSGNRLNIEGLDWFMEQVWQKLKHYDDDLRFIIAGSICKVMEESVDDRVHLFGLFDSPREVYSLGDVFINPMQSGTGLKIKTVEALSQGKFVISTTAGATGLYEMIGNGLICSDEPSVWIEQIVAFFRDPNQKKKELESAEQLISEVYRKNLDVISKSLED
ncbi:glycosyltransferase [Rhodohalobacter sp. 614A]|uniref:glycosyltransferase n=1 Tax=Rhodohalobacter sp. 614A TaxID=2908649 RepID=UPI001F2F9C73|nr:glycosyltransferase [Rhodohalobacter sp. 614A]